MSKTIDPTEKKWLIKTSGKIMGPYSFEQVAADLVERKISMIDEIRSPENRWLFIRESRHFVDVVKKLRDQQVSSHEETGSTSGMTQSITANLTPTPVIVVPNPVPPPNPSTATNGFVKHSEVLETNPPIEKAVPIYASPRDPKVRKKVATQGKKTAFLGWIALFLIVFVGLIAFLQMPKREPGRALGFNDLIKLAKTSRAIGQSERSLELFRKAEAVQALDIPQKLLMIPLLMQVENQNIKARQMLESMAQSDLEPKARSEVESLLALTFLRENRLDEAQKRYLQVAQKFPAHEAASINLIEISILQGEFGDALEQINDLMKTGAREPILFVYRVLAIFRSSNEFLKLEGARADLKRILSQYPDFRSEMLLLMAAIQKKLNQDLDVGESVRALLDVDPDQSRMHLQDPYIHKGVLDWVYLGNICEMLIKENADSAAFRGLNVYCIYQQGDLRLAMDQVEKARSQFSNDASLIALHAFLMNKAGRTSEARALMQFPKASETNLAESLKASLCEAQKDWNCAEEGWRRILQRDRRHIGAYAGLTRISLQRGQQELAQDFLKQGLLISSKYQPFLELKDRLNEK